MYLHVYKGITQHVKRISMYLHLYKDITQHGTCPIHTPNTTTRKIQNTLHFLYKWFRRYGIQWSVNTEINIYFIISVYNMEFT